MIHGITHLFHLGESPIIVRDTSSNFVCLFFFLIIFFFNNIPLYIYKKTKKKQNIPGCDTVFSPIRQAYPIMCLSEILLSQY